MTVTDYPDWDTPQAHATAISRTGAPLLSLATSLFAMGASQSVPASGMFAVPGGPFTVSQIGYEFFVQLSSAAGSTYPFGRLTLTWSDSVSGNTVAVDRYVISGGSAAFQKFTATGPSKGDTLAVTFQNDDTLNAASFQMSMVQNSRVYVRDDLRQLTNVANPAFANGVYDQAAGILLAESPTIGAGSTADRLIAFYSGIVAVQLTAPQPFTATILASDASLGSLSQTAVWQAIVTAAAGGEVYQQVVLPRAQCVLRIANTGTGSATFISAVLVSEQLA